MDPSSEYDKAYEAYRRRDVGERTKRLTGELKSSLAEGRVHFGPVFHVQTSRGQAISISTLKSERSHTSAGTSLRNTRYYLIAQDSDGKVLGLRKTDLRDLATGIESDGEVMTLPDVPGVASTIELTNLFILQNEANTRGRSIVDKGDPANLRRLASLEDMASESDEHWELYQRKLEESNRWSHLFGPEGTYGYNDEYRLTFEPNRAAQITMDILGAVILNRVDREIDGGRRIMEPVVSSVTAAQPDYQKQNLMSFNQNIIPQLEGIIMGGK
ncbi:MAG: hypothetical protein WBO77_01020 [Microgenomates group bacterium]